jgi:hypothetical protein
MQQQLINIYKNQDKVGQCKNCFHYNVDLCLCRLKNMICPHCYKCKKYKLK